MRGYQGIDRAESACVHFVRNNEIGGPVDLLFQEIEARSIDCVYVDYSQASAGVNGLANALATILHLENVPYQSRPWVEFLDDLITLSHRTNGLVIVIDNADVLMATDSNQMFDLIEAFLIQFHHWFEKKKPCHLCFQMEGNDALGKVFEGGRLRKREIAA
jgi:hypothetical protein